MTAESGIFTVRQTSANGAFVQRLLVPACILKVLLIGFGEAVKAAEILLRAEIKIRSGIRLQHGRDTRLRGIADGPGRKALHFVRIVGRVEGGMLIQNTTQTKIPQRKFHRRISTQGHTGPVAVQIHACDLRLFAVFIGFFLHNGGYGNDLQRGESEGCGLLPLFLFQ